MYKTKSFMSGLRLTASQYAIEKNVELFGDLISGFDDQLLTHLSAEVAHVAHLKVISLQVHRYIFTRLLP